MKKSAIISILLFTYFNIFSIFSIFSTEGFFLQNRDGILIKVDVASGINPDYPLKKGPLDVPNDMSSDRFEKEYLATITNDLDKNFILTAYVKDSVKDRYFLRNDFVPEKIESSIIKTSILGNLNVPEKKYISKYYKNNRGYYTLTDKINDDDKRIVSEKVVPLIVRGIFLEYNRANEMETGLDKSGAPSPHRFPRTFNPKTQGSIDIQFCWGYKFEDPKDPNINASLEFSISLVNFTMPSLEILVKHNFVINDNPTLSPYIGGVLYGGFMDGFPIGLSFLGGTDIFPTYYKDQKTNFYLLAEGRLGAVIYSKTYFDTGSNSDGIWKKLGILAEGGFYFGTGYRWDRQ